MTDRYAVMGRPVAHSKSPYIHARFAEQTRQDLRYEAMEVPLGGFARALDEFQAAGGKGLNVTLPFKEEAFRLMDVRALAAERAGAVNTIWFDGRGRRHGDNTDGAGLVRDIVENHGRALRARRVLLVGAGGAARGAVGPLLDQAPERLVIANRTAARAEALAARFAGGGPVRACALKALGEPFELIINATSASLAGEVPALPDAVLAAQAWCYDMVYAETPTPFLRWARARGCPAVDGLGMLVEQAAEAFERWRGVRPDTAPVIVALRGGGA